MIHLQNIGGRRIACWVNNGGVLPDRRTLVFIHGSGGDHTNWIEQYTPLKTTFNIAALDLPGHGQSEGPGEGIGVRLRRVGEEDSRRARDRQARHDRPLPRGRHLPHLCHPLRRCGRRGGPGRRGREDAGQPGHPGGAADRTPAAIIALAGKIVRREAEPRAALRTPGGGLSRVDPEIIHGDFSACDGLDITEAIAGIRIPALVVCGAEDKMTPPPPVADIRDSIPGARLALIEEAGHFVMLENPAAFNTALTDFVNSLT